ncbi:TIGR03857 family LLM class F420-dependent oxidoreductase [Streptomyces sp. FIT100]|uniref:TIGR03857 family LLM class F420-dependent oxidoreductase n=1 Tax=Streptomyces sp. FIT100 TaxID=2837956 RepID=UPI0021C57D52|nr:TIGR03857 family LLM class F420-dependent oxidoreductase [Streptomyces sp. FIT100]UUN29851.1 TIGR03857 family LLM class F420-dependent oxidoreductase [Streptomyces sp. FIT100]
MTPSPQAPLPLGSYVLSGGTTDPRLAISQAHAAERIGLATLWISERLGHRDLGVVAGALGWTTTRVHIGSAITPFHIRHPAVLASLASTLQTLTQGRFLLGLGRGGPWLAGLGVTPTTPAQAVVDIAVILRRLWAGDTVTYHGPAGHYPRLKLAGPPQTVPTPLLMAALGPRSLRLAGQHFDGVILPAFLTPQAVAQMTATVRSAAAASGRDPAALRVYATVITIANPAPQDRDIIAGRAVGYLHPSPHGERIAHLNGWDPAPLARLRVHPLLADLDQALADEKYRPQELAGPARLIPDSWLTASTATGPPAVCARRLAEYLDAGANELILHGSPPDHLSPVTTAYHRATAPGPLPTADADHPHLPR